VLCLFTRQPANIWYIWRSNKNCSVFWTLGENVQKKCMETSYYFHFYLLDDRTKTTLWFTETKISSVSVCLLLRKLRNVFVLFLYGNQKCFFVRWQKQYNFRSSDALPLHELARLWSCRIIKIDHWNGQIH
jgi:hypothetical protein